TFAVIGDPIDHSLSPNIHNAAFRSLNLDCTYIAYRVLADELESGIAALKSIGVAGFNITIPHKIAVMHHLDVVDENCSVVGACNTVSNAGGTLKGHNTDMEGFLDPIRRRGIPIRGSRVLLLGAAGFARERAESITVANRTLARGASLAGFAEAAGLQARYVGPDRIGPLSEYKFVVNATAVGLKGELSPLDLGTLGPDSVVYDIVYRPMKTDLIAKAGKMGATIIYGYEMLLGQAARAFEIWHGTEAPYGAMKRALLGGV
ncbi:Shikimate dehydrogenase (NADP(+)), partial [Geodia barretti]